MSYKFPTYNILSDPLFPMNPMKNLTSIYSTIPKETDVQKILTDFKIANFAALSGNFSMERHVFGINSKHKLLKYNSYFNKT